METNNLQIYYIFLYDIYLNNLNNYLNKNVL